MALPSNPPACQFDENGVPLNFPCAPGVAGTYLNGSSSMTVPLDAATQDATGVKGDPGGSGSSTLTIDRSNNRVCATTSWSGIDTPVVAAHIHGGSYGQPEDPAVTISLFDPDFVNGVQSPASGCSIVPGPLLTEIVKCPQQFNIVVHSQQLPAGAIRGQLGSYCIPPVPFK
jgi:hypothetical protein